MDCALSNSSLDWPLEDGGGSRCRKEKKGFKVNTSHSHTSQRVVAVSVRVGWSGSPEASQVAHLLPPESGIPVPMGTR